MRSSASRLSRVTVVLMLTLSGARLARAAACSRRRPVAVRSNVPLHASGGVVQFARAVDRDADVPEETGQRQIGERGGPALRDGRSVRREVAAGVALLPEQVEHLLDVLPHEHLAARQADLQPFPSGNAVRSASSGQLLAPLALEVEQVADVAELALQVAAHRRFVDDAVWQTTGHAGPFAEKARDAPIVSAVPPAGVDVLCQPQAAQWSDEEIPQAARHDAKCLESAGLTVDGSAYCTVSAFLFKPGSVRVVLGGRVGPWSGT